MWKLLKMNSNQNHKKKLIYTYNKASLTNLYKHFKFALDKTRR